MHSQTLEEAPANVTVITAADIRKYGYRTLNEALSSVRGFYSSYDRMYHYVGVRGLAAPGDFNTRFLVMLNGHPLTEDVYDANGAFGQDFPIDMDLISRIEIVRGATSALYGSNGILANINIVTKSPVDMGAFQAQVETGSYGEKKATAISSVDLKNGANLLISASVFNSAGGTIPGESGAEPVDGVDGERGYHTFANLVWGGWSFTALFNNRLKQAPAPWGDTALMYHRGNAVRDARNLVLASYTRHAGPGTLRWRIYYDQYKYDDRFDYPTPNEIEDVRARQRGDALGGQATFQFGLRGIGELLVGGSVDGELRDLQQDRTVHPSLVYRPAISDPDASAGIFAQQEWKATRSLTVYAGLRLDTTEQEPAVSPRLAAVWKNGATNYKLVYGRPFRQPSSFERLYTDGGKSWLANPGLHSETAHTVELSAERKLRGGFKAIVNAYHYRLNRVIQAAYGEGGVSQYWNSGWARSQGLEVELETSGERFEMDASCSYQAGRRRNDPELANVPRHIAKFRGAVPLANKRLWLSSSLQYISSRQTRSHESLRPVALLDLTLSMSEICQGLDLQAGVRNLAGWRYSDPVDLGVESMPANGRSWFLKITYDVSD